MERLTIDKVIDLVTEGNQIRKHINIKLAGMESVSEYDLAQIEVLELLKELKSYRETEEKGLLLELPCKVGDTVAIILMIPISGKCFVQQAEVKEINVGRYSLRHDIQLKVEPIANRGTSYKYYASEWGKNVFPSLAEAEQALERIQKENG